MPLDWDTSYYIMWTRITVTKTSLKFIMDRKRLGFRILYPYIASMFVRLSVDPAVVELFPIISSLLLIWALPLL